MSRETLGLFEMNVMKAALCHYPRAYTTNILLSIKEWTGKEPSVGAVHTTLQRLKERGYLEPRKGEATAERGGRAKTYYDITASGQQILGRSEAGARRMLDAMPQGALV